MYITKTDYLDFDGVDLSIELPDNDNAKGKVERFLREVEDWTLNYCRRYGFNESLINSRNIDRLKRGLLYQVRHFLDKGRDNKLDYNTWSEFHIGGLVRVITGV